MMRQPSAVARSRESWASSFLKGAFAGFLATAPMTVAMIAMHRQLPRHQRYPLPPSLITRNLERKARVEHAVGEDEHLAATMLNHFGYGTAAGSLYGVADRYIKGPGPVKGIGYGLLVWAGSYLGLLPALGLLTPATQHPTRRNLLMIAAHVVWGAVLGFLVDRFKPKQVSMVSPRAPERGAGSGETLVMSDSSSFREPARASARG